MVNIPKTMRAMTIPHHGDASVIEQSTLPTPTPQPGQILVKIEWAGVNFIDIYYRNGTYPNQGEWPMILGTEAAGEIVQIPDDEKTMQDPMFKTFDYKVGGKVALQHNGVYAEYVAVDLKEAFPVPAALSDTRLVASTLTQGLTAISFLTEAYDPKPDEWILIHSAAGGLGILLTQLASAKKVKVIGTASNDAKTQMAKANGATETIVSTKENVVERVLQITSGKGVAAVYDGIGKDTWDNNFKLIARKGTIISFGNASGVVPPFSPLKLAEKNVKLVRPAVWNYLSTPGEIKFYTNKLWEALDKGALRTSIHKEYAFTAEEVRHSHEEMLQRSRVGKMIVKVA